MTIKKNYKLKLKVKGQDVPDWGLGIGVLVEQMLTYAVESEEETSKWPFTNSLMQACDEFLHTHVEVVVEELPNE